MESLSGELGYERMTNETLPLALELRREGWPNEEIKKDYFWDLGESFDAANQIWLVYYSDELVGLTGIYTFDEDESGWDNLESVWMDWFMIRAEYRRRGFGKQVLLDTIDYCRRLGKFKYFRLDTIFWEGRPAVKLYDKVMGLCEKYTREIPQNGDYYVVYSYALHGDDIKPWDNQLLSLNGAE